MRKKKTIRKILALTIVLMMILPVLPMLSASADNNVLYENAGPVTISTGGKVDFGNGSGWTDYEVEFDFKPTALNYPGWECNGDTHA